MNVKTLKKEIRKSLPSLTWKSDDVTYKVTKDLYLMYFDGNLELCERMNDFGGKVKKQILSSVHKNVLSDFEFMYFMCKTGEHPNGRDLEWLKNEGLTAVEK